METYAVYVDGDPVAWYAGSPLTVTLKLDGETVVDTCEPAWEYAVDNAEMLVDIYGLRPVITVVRESDGTVLWKDGYTV